MNNTYLLKLEEKIKEQEAQISNFQKEQSASIQVFKDKEQEINNLNNSLTTLTSEQEKAKGKLTKLEQKAKETNSQLKEIQEKNKSLEEQLANYINETELLKERNNTLNQELTKTKERLRESFGERSLMNQNYINLKDNYQNQTKTLEQVNNQLLAETQKNQLLEEKLLEAQNQAQEANSPPPISIGSEKWEKEKEELLKTFERTRNEMGEEITKLEKENNQLDQDLNKAVDLLEEKDKTISDLQKQKTTDQEHILEKHNPYKDKVKELQTKIAEQDKTIQELKNQGENKENVKPEQFTCYHCQKQQEFSLLVLELPEGKLCQPC